jgi:hypothetical protein
MTPFSWLASTKEVTKDSIKLATETQIGHWWGKDMGCKKCCEIAAKIRGLRTDLTVDEYICCTLESLTDASPNNPLSL